MNARYHRVALVLSLPLLLVMLLAAPVTVVEAAPADDVNDGWLTATDYPPIGDPRAKRVPGSTFRISWPYFPPTLRTDGPSSNLVQTRTIHSLMFETLVGIHPETEEFIPSLASHWKIETDKENNRQTFWFRIDPRARWADGSAVTANDVAKTYWHMIQEDRNDPSNAMTYSEGFHPPEVVDERTIKVTTKKLNWRLFLYFSGMRIFPAKYIGIPGEQFLEDYNWKFMMGSGPYHLAKPEHIKKGDSLIITRRKDWWSENDPGSKNLYNFDRIKFLVVRDRELEFEMFKKGELDHFRVQRAQRWVEDIPQEELVQKGWVKRRKVYNQAPQGFSGFAFNMREKPFDDKRVRLAFSYLFNRERLMKKLFFNEYDYIDSYFPGRDWGNAEENPKIRFDPDRAAELLDEAGYQDYDDDGYLVNSEGKRLEITLTYGAQAWERIWLVVKPAYEEAGIKFNLKLIDGATLIKNVSDRQFNIHFQSWGALLFPNPETSWRSSLADKKANNNLPGFKNERVDELCARYNEIFDRTEQKKITREIDSIVFNEHPYALGWYANFHRILYWDQFGHPDTYFTRIGQDPEDDMIMTWWIDSGQENALKAAQEAGSKLPQGTVEHRPWAKK